MNSVRPARSILSRCVSVSSTPAMPCRLFHSSVSRSGRRRSRFNNITAEKMGLTTPDAIDSYAKRQFPEYTEEEKATLKQRYTPEQWEALEAAEAAIDPKDLVIQGRLRTDPYKQPYVEDFATIRPVIDAKPQKTLQPKEVKWLPRREWVDNYIEKMADRVDTQLHDTMGRAFARALRKVKNSNPEKLDFTEEELYELEENPELRRKFLVEQDPDVLGGKRPRGPKRTGIEDKSWMNLIDKHFFEELEQSLATAENPLQSSRLDSWKAIEGEHGNSALSAELGKVEGVKGLYKPPDDPEDDGLDPTGQYAKLKNVTGMKMTDILSVLTKRVVLRSVSNQTRLGKIRSASVVVVAGNGDGRLGVGEAKSTDMHIATATATLLAIRNMKPIRRYENRTIFGNVEAKISGTVVKLASRPPGFGLRVSHRIFEMARLAGIHDLAATIPRSNNPYNTVYAVHKALMNQPDPEEMAIGRGKKLVDVRKVYYGGSVY
ncbi:37S ribosomal protein S5, mitochondrial [Colletotrichum tanaceti]|uniref:37S ribosomal protein S5, mitochondrial n=1 Tax=Colletotrichum tanaceti TaxID=1306861 RepID=A0A4U6XAF4_9PEZI|nr:37S ribosomal protein S5, mitochondrial [Colletotrichum tanaceti]TKW52203.1 37S ribosomal protein S5, mitochondrial [Colletotrichum tanaceti]